MAIIFPTNVGTYHRIDDIIVCAAAPMIRFTLYSWPDESARRRSKPSIRTQWEFPCGGMPTSGSCYESLLMREDWKGAESDDAIESSGLCLSMAQPVGLMSWDGSKWVDPNQATLQGEISAAVSAIDTQMAEIERRQSRAVRDALLSLAQGGSPVPEALSALQDIESAIVPLREKRNSILAAETIEEVKNLLL